MMLIFFNIKGFSKLETSNKKPIYCGLQRWETLVKLFVKDNYAISLDNSDFIKGSLNKPSNIRPNRLFAAEKSIITRKIGTIKPKVFEKVVDKLFEIIKH